MIASGQIFATSTGNFPQQMMTASGQIITASSGSFPQYISEPGKSAIFVNQSDFTPANANQALVFEQYGIVANQQSVSSLKTVAGSQREKIHTSQNQLVTLQPNSFYASTMPVQSSSQGFNKGNIREISSQPQVITTQASGTMLNQAQLLGLQAVDPLQPGLSCTPGLQPYQNPIIIYNQQSGMAVQQFQPQMAMYLPVGAAPLPFAATVATQKQKQLKFIPKGKNVIGTSGASPSPSNPLMTAVFAQTNQASCIPLAQQNSLTDNHIYSNPVQFFNDQTKFSVIKSKLVSKILSPQKSQAIVAPFSQIPQTGISPTSGVSAVPMTSSILAFGSSTGASPSPSNTQMAITDAQMNETTSIPVEQQSNADNQTCPIPVQGVDYQTKSDGIESKPVSVETEISSPQESQVMDTSCSQILQTCVEPTPVIASSVVSMAPSTLRIESSIDASPSPSNIEMVTAHTQMNQVPSTPVAQEKSMAADQTYPNPVQIINDQIKSTETENEPECFEMKISSSQKSQAVVAPFNNNPQACVTPTINAVSVASSALTIAPSTISVMAGSSVQVDTSVSTVDTITSSMSTISPIPPVPCLANKEVSDFNSKSSLPKSHNEAVDTSHQTKTIETVVTIEHLKSQQIIQKPSLEQDKQPQKAIVKPKVLTHVINGFVIQESSEPFPVSQFPSLDSLRRKLRPKKTESPEEKENSLTVSNPESNMKILRPRRNVELANCELCGKVEAKFRFKGSKRFCSKNCVKQFDKNNPKRVGMPALAVQGHASSGRRGRKRKRSRGRKRIQKQSLEDENTKASPDLEIPPVPEDETTISCTEEDNSVPPSDSAHQIPMKEDELNNEIGVKKTDLSQKLPSKWTVQEVFELVQNFTDAENAENFKSQEVDGQALLLLNEGHLRTALGMKLGPALKLLSHIRSIEEALVTTA